MHTVPLIWVVIVTMLQWCSVGSLKTNSNSRRIRCLLLLRQVEVDAPGSVLQLCFT